METRVDPPQRSAAPRRGPYIWEDFIALPDDDRRELINGELVEVEAPNKLHEYIQAKVCRYLDVWADEHEAGFVLAAGYKVKISRRRGVMPDLQFYRNENPTKGDQQGLSEGYPDLTVEIVSPSSERYDRATQLAWYAGIGVPEYWIVSPDLRMLERLVLKAGRYMIMATCTENDVFKPESFPGLELPLAKLWTIPGLKPGRH